MSEDYLAFDGTPVPIDASMQFCVALDAASIGRFRVTKIFDCPDVNMLTIEGTSEDGRFAEIEIVGLDRNGRNILESLKVATDPETGQDAPWMDGLGS